MYRTLFFVILVPSVAQAQYLFQPTDTSYSAGGSITEQDGDGLLPAETQPMVQRRLTTPNLSVLSAAIAQGSGAMVPVNLFDDANIVVAFRSNDYSADLALAEAEPVWLGDVILPDEYPSGGEHPGRAWFMLYGGRLYGEIEYDDRRFRILPLSDGSGKVAILEHADPSEWTTTCAGSDLLPGDEPEIGAPIQGPFPNIQESIRVAVILTKRLRTRTVTMRFGAVSVVVQLSYVPRVQAEMANTNAQLRWHFTKRDPAAFVMPNPILKLVAINDTQNLYDDGATTEADIDYARSPAGKWMLDFARDNEANLLSIIRWTHGAEACGRHKDFITTSAFGLERCEPYVLQHEQGHWLGAQHDTFASTKPGIEPIAGAFSVPPAPPHLLGDPSKGRVWRDVMTYGDGCLPNGGWVGCSKTSYFSSAVPAYINWWGKSYPLGDSDHDNVGKMMKNWPDRLTRGY